jgi:hypothetical protein
MHENEGRGRWPGAPKNLSSASPKEQGSAQREKVANNSLVSPVERKLSDKSGDKKIENVGLSKTRGVVFDCAAPEVIPSPFHIRRMLRDEIATEEQAQELGQQWLGELKTMDRQSLEREARWWKTTRDRFAEDQKQEEVQEIEQQLEVIREQLRQRGVE